MRIKFLVSVPAAVPDDTWTAGEMPAVPCFPSQHDSAFLCIGTWKLAKSAKVEEVDVDPDSMADAMYAEYPGIPRAMHEAYVMKVFEFAFGCSPGEEFEIRVSQDAVYLIPSGGGAQRALWEKKPWPVK